MSPFIDRMKKLGVVVVTQPPFMYYNGERYLAEVPVSKQPYLYPFKSLLDGELVAAGSSDMPVVPGNPLMGIYGAVARKAKTGQLLQIEERISAQQALEMYTGNAAYASFEENDKGTISGGKLADMVVLNDNPLKSAPEQIKDIKVEMTITGGEVVWESG